MNGAAAVAGSPLAARQSALPYAVLMGGLILIGILFLIWLASRIIKKHRESPEYIEKMKNRQTTLQDVQALAKKIDLSRAEAMTLYNICSKQKSRNIYYLWNDLAYVDGVFREEYRRLRQKGNEDGIFSLFKLRTHLEKVLTLQKTIPSSRNIPEGEFLVLPATGGRFYSFKIEKNEKDSITLQTPPNLEGTEFCPSPLAKIVMTYLSKEDIQYVLSTRVIRFQNAIDGHRQTVIQHSNTVSMQNRRQFKRVNVGVNCKFSAVEEVKGKKGDVSYVKKENEYEGRLADVSAGGCMIQTKLPIKSNQKLWIKIRLPDAGEFETFGLIVSAQKNRETEVYSLHIAFIDIDARNRNDIFSYVYKYA